MPSLSSVSLIGALILALAVLYPRLDISWRSPPPPASPDPHVVCRHHLAHSTSKTSPVVCPVQPPRIESSFDWDPAADQAFTNISYHRLAGAIQIPTVSFDDSPEDPTDPRWDVFYELERYLKTTFPLFHKTMKLEKVNTHGLLYTWGGSRPELKPIILMAHQDVVPVNPSTMHQWKHPPFSAHFDNDGWIWGRGTTDMKSTLVGLMAATEKLIEEGFEPERTIMFSHGFDEEIGGPRGAKELAKVILDRYGLDSVALIVDEGFIGVDEEFGTSFARVGVAEKGCLTLNISLETEGGHSSRPFKHTGIGMLSRILVEMENHPQQAKLIEGNPLLTYMECAAEYGTMDETLERKIRCAECWPALAEEFGEDRVLATFLKTTQAIDIISGGNKYNALPENVVSLTNYRVDFFESTRDTIDKVINIITPLAREFNLTFDIFGSHPEVEENVIHLTTFGIVLEPAPLTPVVGPAWELIGGTLKNQFPGTVVVPSGMTAFTDTQYYWGISKHIYRFTPASLQHIKNYHTVNERIHIDAHMSTIRFFHQLIRNSIGWVSE